MMRALLLPWLLLCFVVSYGQSNTYQLTGYATDATSGEIVIGAFVYVPVEGKIMGSATNAYGFYSLSLPGGNYRITASMVGYQPFSDTLKISQNTQLNIRLHPKNNVLEEVVVEERRDSTIFKEELDHIRIARDILLKTPRFGGEADVMKTLQFLPGVKQGNEGSAGLHIRGGSPDQNLMLLDGVPVYNMYHAFGYLSVFNTEAINDVRVYKSGISSRYEGRLSSVIDISLKEGDIFKSKKSFTLSPIAGSFLWEGPLRKEKSSFIITGRRTWLDALMNLANVGENEKRGYNFYDVSGKFNFLLNEKGRMFLSVYSSGDKFYDRMNNGAAKSEYGFKWGNQTIAGRHIHHLSSNTFFSNLVYFSRYHFNQVDSYEGTNQRQFREITSFIRDLNIRSQLEYYPDNHHRLIAGVEAGTRKFRPEIVQTASGNSEISTKTAEDVNAQSLSFFLEDQITFSKTEILLSSRQTLYSIRSKEYFHVQPHALISYDLLPRIRLKAAYDNTVQYLHLLTNTTMGQPTDLWVPATEAVSPQRSQQISLGATYAFANRVYTIGLEGYLKKMQDVVEYKEGANYLYGVNDSWEDKVVSGDGYARGLELLMKKNLGKLNGWVSYTLSKSTRAFEELNNGNQFPYKYDRTHDLSVVAIYDLNRRNQFSATFTFNTGNAITLPVATVENPVPPFFEHAGSSSFTDNFQSQPLYTNRNNFRMPAYHRADLSYQNVKETKRGRIRSWIISVYNTYNRLNPYFIYEQNGKLRQYAFFPIIPSVAYKIEFK